MDISHTDRRKVMWKNFHIISSSAPRGQEASPELSSQGE
jgi:hypothetical protein